MIMLRLNYKIRYYKTKVCNFFGYCGKCYTKGNRTSSGRLICPNCGR